MSSSSLSIAGSGQCTQHKRHLIHLFSLSTGFKALQLPVLNSRVVAGSGITLPIGNSFQVFHLGLVFLHLLIC